MQLPTMPPTADCHCRRCETAAPRPFACPKHRRNDARCPACRKAWETATYTCTQCAPATEVREIDRYTHDRQAEVNGSH